MAGLTLEMSLTKWRAEYYLVKRKSISLLQAKTSSLVSFYFSDWIKTNRLLQRSASVCVDRFRQIFVASQSVYVHSKLLEHISHFCVNFLVNPPDRHVSVFSTYVTVLTDQNSS